jgi:hypothetical protein
MGMMDPRLGLIALAIGAGALSVTGFVAYFKGRTAGRAQVQAVLDGAVAEANAAAEQASQAYRLLEQKSREQVSLAETKYREREHQHDQEINSVRLARDADISRLRRALASSSPSSAASSASAPAPGDCATIAGGLLGKALQTTAELADDAERAADAYRAMLDGWPK